MSLLASLTLLCAPFPQAQAGEDPFTVERHKVTELARVVERAPDSGAAWTRLAMAQLTLGRRTGEHRDLEAAEASFARLAEAAPGNETGWFGMAYARIGRHELPGALDAAREVARLLPEEPRTLALLGDVHFALGNYVEAEALYERLHAQQLDLASLARVGLVHEVRGRRAEALRFLREALEAGRLLGAPATELAWAHGLIGDVLYQSGELEASERELREAIALDPGSHFAPHVLAQVQVARGRWQAAEDTLRALTAWAIQPGYWVQFAGVLAHNGRSEEAAAWYAKAEEDMLGDLAIGDLGHLRELAEYWLEHGGDVERAAELALLDLEEVRHDLGAYATAAWALYRCGRIPEAKAMMDRALRIGGGDPRVHERAAEIRRAAIHASLDAS